MTPAEHQTNVTFARQMQKYHRALMAAQAALPGHPTLEAQFNPAAIGARKAPDGHLADPTRPGKYRQVISR